MGVYFFLFCLKSIFYFLIGVQKNGGPQFFFVVKNFFLEGVQSFISWGRGCIFFFNKIFFEGVEKTFGGIRFFLQLIFFSFFLDIGLWDVGEKRHLSKVNKCQKSKRKEKEQFFFLHFYTIYKRKL